MTETNEQSALRKVLAVLSLLNEITAETNDPKAKSAVNILSALTLADFTS